ncbi:MAG: matrixin family metalloprotease [Polyangiales bacterium]
MKALRHGLLAALCLTAVTSSALAWTPQDAQWNPASLPIGYRVNANTAPSSIGASGALTAIDGGMATWAAPTCTRWRSTNQGATAVTRASARDNVNTFLWLSGTWPAELGSTNVTIGVTTPVFIPGRYVLDADIQFNAVGFTWTNTGARGAVDTQSIATHEEGHFLGLDHTNVRAAVMFASYSGGNVRNLNQDDIAGVCALYPSGGAVPDAGPAQDPCGAFTSCAGCTPNANCGWCEGMGRCQTGTSSGATMGGACTGNWRWDPNSCTATADPCAAFTNCGSCTAQNQCGWCGATNRCVRGTPTGPATGGACGGYAWTSNMCAAATMDAGTAPVDAGTVPPTDAGGMGSGTARFGEPCQNRTDCASGLLCVGGSGVAPFCTRVCTDDCTCPRGYGCAARLASGQTVCAPGANGCVSGGTDAGNPTPDVVVVPRDSGPTAMPDVVTVGEDVVSSSPDVVITLPDAGKTASADAGTPTFINPNATSGCGCRTARPSTPPGALLVTMLGLAALRRRRRRA